MLGDLNPHRHDLTRILFAGLGHIDEWRLGDPAQAAELGYPRRYPAEALDDCGIVFVDVVLDHRTGQPVCHEVNGPNGVGSDALTGESSARAENEAQQTVRRLRELGCVWPENCERPAVTLHAHQHWKAFRTGCEFYARVADFAACLSRLLPNATACLRGAAESLGAEQVSVVLGDVPSVAANLEIGAGGQFEYRGRPVAFLGNPNLLVELKRLGKLRPETTADLRVLHGWRLAHVIHDKAHQQQLLAGTGIEPLRHFSAQSPAEALARSRELLAHGPVVLKPNGTSGGTGVHVVVPQMSDREIAARIDAVVADCVAKYGEHTERSVWPLRGFEFVRSTGYPLAGREHLWDLRIAVQFEPGRAEVYPVSLRITPQPFDPATFHLDREQWVSNVSGRSGYLLKSGMDQTTLAAVDLTPLVLERIFRAAVRWTMKAWDEAARGGQPAGVHEDACERIDPQFYPRQKFAA